MKEEIWLPVKDFEDCYQISNYGIIRSTDRVIRSETRPYLLKGKILKYKIDKDGYSIIELRKGERRKWVSAHRLVAIHFIPNPENLPQINHMDTIKSHNYVENLEWCTGKENQQHAIKMGLRDNVAKKGEDSNLSKLTWEEVNSIRGEYNKKTCNQKCLAERYNISITTIFVILNNKTWQQKKKQ